MGIKEIIHNIRLKRRKRKVGNRYKRDITKHFKDLKTRRSLTSEQKREIQDFFKGLIGRKVSLYCHEYFYSRTGVYSKEYIPTDLYNVELLGRANMLPYNPVFKDKNFTDVFLKGVRQPHTILKNINGYYYYEGEAVSREEAISRCQNMENVLIKPAGKNQGKGIEALTVKDGVTSIGGKSIGEVFDKYKKNFQIQERLKQHERMSALNPTSVNTIRILTFRSGMEILIIYAVVRIGKMGAFVDNQCAGGISTAIDENGKLSKFAFGGYDEDNITKTDTGILLEGYLLPSYDKVIEAVKKLHYQLPYYDLVGWDMAVAEDGEPVVIEWNTNTGLSQSAFGPGFGKYTERIIKELWKKPNWRKFL